MANANIGAQGIFTGSKAPKVVQNDWNGFRGVTDFGLVEQFSQFDSGRAFLVLIDKPAFLKQLATKDAYKDLLNSAWHIMEYEFKGLSGIEDKTAETLEINDGLNTINFINKVKKQSASTVTMRYNEKAGAPLTKTAELFLEGIYDTATGFKHYHGLIEDPNANIVPGYQSEIYTLLYFVVDPTGFEIETAYLLLGCQHTKAELSIYESERGNHDAKEIGVEFQCFPVRGRAVNEMALAKLKNLSVIRNADKIRYTGTEVSSANESNYPVPRSGLGGSDKSGPIAGTRGVKAGSKISLT